jgi:hypothetical protein
MCLSLSQPLRNHYIERSFPARNNQIRLSHTSRIHIQVQSRHRAQDIPRRTLDTLLQATSTGLAVVSSFAEIGSLQLVSYVTQSVSLRQKGKCERPPRSKPIANT